MTKTSDFLVFLAAVAITAYLGIYYCHPGF